MCTKGVNCGQGAVASLYFWVFTLFGAYILINMYASVMLETFEHIQGSALDTNKFGTAIQQWSQVWGCYDKHATGSVACKDFVKLMSDAKPPLGFGTHVLPRVVYMRRLREQALVIRPPTIFNKEWTISCVIFTRMLAHTRARTHTRAHTHTHTHTHMRAYAHRTHFILLSFF